MDDRTERAKADAELDRELEGTFPASDPLKVTRFKAGSEFTSAKDTEPPDEPEQGVTFLTCDLAEAVATARAVAGGKNLEILGADLASQCLQRGLVDEVLVYVLPVLLGDGVRFSTSGLGRIDLEPFSNRQSGPVTMLRFRVRKEGAVSN